MIDLKSLKEKVENNQISDSLIIFKCLENHFVANQYINQIAKNKNQVIEQVFELDGVIGELDDMFYAPDPTTMRVFITTTLDCLDENLCNVCNLCIICDKVDKESETLFDSFIVNIPKLENWMYTDYIKSKAEGLSDKQVEYLYNICGNNIYRIDNELKKVAVFEPTQQQSAFNDFVSEGLFNDLSQSTIFDLSTALIQRDCNKVREIYKVLDCIDVEPMGLWVVLYKNIRNIIQIQLDSSATASKLGMSDKQFYVVKKYSCGHYSRSELLKMFDVITDIDRKIKVGEFPVSELRDYLIVSVLGVC